MKTKELVETEVLVCDWCGAAHAVGGRRANGLVIQEFGEFHLCCRAVPDLDDDLSLDLNRGRDTLVFDVSLEPEADYDLRSLSMIERVKAERDPPLSCFTKVLAFGVRCRRADVVDTDGEIKLSACRECGTRFDPNHPHIADGLCATCAPAGLTCPVCHRAMDEVPNPLSGTQPEAPIRTCTACAAAALAG